MVVASLATVAWLLAASVTHAFGRDYWKISSPDHEQTFAYGTEQSRVLTAWGRDKHLAVLLSFTNDPYVDRQNPRQYDNFTFSFPSIMLGKDDQTFYFHAPDGRLIPVAKKHPVFVGSDVRLLPNATLLVNKPHGYLTLMIALNAGS
jgi:hypothetical protein